MKNYIKVLTIAGSDSSGGAGIQADLKTFMAHGCYGMSAITALTAQNTQGVSAIYPTTANFVAKQINAVISDIGVDAIKIGMLFNNEIITAVAEQLKPLCNIPIILDPVMIAKGGCLLLEKSAINALQNILFPLTTIITPNLPEAEVLLQQKIVSPQDMEQATKQLCTDKLQAVLIKGGHLTTKEANDCLYIKQENKIHWLNAERIDTPNTHGTGCTLSAAIAANLAKQQSLFNAVDHAKQYLTNAIKEGSHYKLGLGHGPVWHNTGVKSWPPAYQHRQ